MAINSLQEIFDLVSPASAYTGQLKNRGLINAEDYDKAQKSSIGRGLLDFGLNYFAQDFNKNYGSALPYLAKPILSGLSAAEKPFEQLQKNILTTDKFETMAKQNELRDKLLLDPRVKGNPLYEGIANKDAYQLATLLAKNKDQNLFSKDSQSKYTPDSVKLALDAISKDKPIIEARKLLVRDKNAESFENIQKTTYFAKNKVSGEMTGVFFDKSAPKGQNKFRAMVNGKNVPVNDKMFGSDGMNWINMGQEGKFTKDVNSMDALELEINSEDTSIRELSRYIKTAGSLPSGMPKLYNQFTEMVKAFTNANADEYTEAEILQRMQEGRMQGLLGRLRLETVGGGVMTEQDALRIVAKLGGDPATAFNNPVLVQKAIGEVMASKYKTYSKKVGQYNDQISRGFGSMGKQKITPLQIDSGLFYGSNAESAIEAMTGNNYNTTQSVVPNTGLSISEQAKREKEKRKQRSAD